MGTIFDLFVNIGKPNPEFDAVSEGGAFVQPPVGASKSVRVDNPDELFMFYHW